MTTAVVVLTANHWLLDAVAGGALVLACWWAARRPYGPRRRPVERDAAAVAVPEDFALSTAENHAVADVLEPPEVRDVPVARARLRPAAQPT